MAIHPSAIIHKGAEIDASAEIGPFCIVGPRVKIGSQTRLIAHVVVQNHTTLGHRNIIHPFACIGGNPQDKKFRGEPARLVVGDDNVVRESVTLNIGTEQGLMQTSVGNGCLLMAYSHVAHDCRLGNSVVLANGVALGGHVDVHDNVVLGGLAGIHQYCRIGRFAFVGGGAMVAQDIPPFCIAQGDRATLAGLNLIGLRRAGWPRERIHDVRRAFRSLFYGERPRLETLQAIESESDTPAEVQELCTFIRTASRGVCSGRREENSTDAS